MIRTLFKYTRMKKKLWTFHFAFSFLFWPFYIIFYIYRTRSDPNGKKSMRYVSNLKCAKITINTRLLLVFILPIFIVWNYKYTLNSNNVIVISCNFLIQDEQRLKIFLDSKKSRRSFLIFPLFFAIDNYPNPESEVGWSWMNILLVCIFERSYITVAWTSFTRFHFHIHKIKENISSGSKIKICKLF